MLGIRTTMGAEIKSGDGYLVLGSADFWFQLGFLVRGSCRRRAGEQRCLPQEPRDLHCKVDISRANLEVVITLNENMEKCREVRNLQILERKYPGFCRSVCVVGSRKCLVFRFVASHVEHAAPPKNGGRLTPDPPCIRRGRKRKKKYLACRPLARSLPPKKSTWHADFNTANRFLL